jgi:transposase
MFARYLSLVKCRKKNFTLKFTVIFQPLKMRRVTEPQRKEIVKFRKKGLSYSEISRRTKLPVFTVRKYCGEIKIKCKNNKGGRPRRLTDEICNKLIEGFDKNKHENLNDGRCLLKEKFNIEVTKQTVKNYLKRKGLKCFIKRKKPFLTENHKIERLKFSEKYFDFNYQDWKKVIFSDECRFSLDNTNKKEFYWKKVADPLNEKHIKKTKKFGGGSIMTWGCLTSEGTGELVRLNGKIDSAKYIQVLRDDLIKTIDNFNFDLREVKFMQDNAPIHTAKSTMDWLKINKINVLDWPACSPDLNPIENLWEIIDQKIRKSPEKPKTLDELWNIIKRIWYSIDKDKVRNLYLSMPNRINSCVEAKGSHIKY